MEGPVPLRTSITPAAHQQHTSSTPLTTQVFDQDHAPASHQHHTSSTPAAHQPRVQESDAPPAASGARVPTGRVVSITTRNWRGRGYAGSLQPSDRLTPGRTNSLLFSPVEKRFPFIRVATKQAETLMSKRIVVVVDEWPADSGYPIGHYAGTIGDIGDKDTETEVLLLEFDVNTAPFSDAVHKCVPPLPWVGVTAEDLADPHREDLRGTVVCSVDPPGCKDIDDALHARKLPNGNLEVRGLHTLLSYNARV